MKRMERTPSVYLILAPCTQEAVEQEDMFKLALETKFEQLGEFQFGSIFPWTTCELPISMPSLVTMKNGCLAISDGCLNSPLFQICVKYKSALEKVCDEYGYIMTIVTLE